MFRCGDCDNVFEEPQKWQEDHGEMLIGCPRCGGSYYEVEECFFCGRVVPVGELTDGICSSCWAED